MNMVAACVAAVMAFSGCISLEKTKAQLASGDPEQVKQAKDKILDIVDNGHAKGFDFSLRERLAFLDLVTDAEFRIEIAQEAATYQKYECFVIRLAALEKIDCKKPGMAAKILRTFRSYFDDEIGYDWIKQSDGMFWHMSVDATTSLDSMNDTGGVSAAKSPYTALANKLVAAMTENELIGLACSPNGSIDRVGKIVAGQVRKTTKSPDMLCRILLGETGELDKEEQQAIEKRLIPNVAKISNLTLIAALLSETSYAGVRYVSDRQLVARLVARLPDSEKEVAASAKKRSAVVKLWKDGCLKDEAYNVPTKEQFALAMLDRASWLGDRIDEFEYAIIAAALAKKPELSIKIADGILDKTTQYKGLYDNAMNLQKRAHRVDEKLAKAEKFMGQLVKLAGKNWFVSALAKVEGNVLYMTKHITPEIAADVLAKGGVKSRYVEECLVAKIAPEKVTLKMFKDIKSDKARETLTKRIPQKVKDALANAEKQAVQRILSEAKTKEGKTFVLGGFYLGMPVADAETLLRHYAGQSRAVDVTVLDNGMPAIKLGGQRDDYFALAYSDTKTVRDFNFGPWILRKFCDYDAQNYLQWIMAFNKDKGLNMVPDSINENDNVYIRMFGDGQDYPVHLAQVIGSYKNAKQGYRLIYFGERQFVTAETGIGERIVQEKAAEQFRYISAHEGTLRAKIWRE
jgi:hypothetical protein